MKKIKNIQIFLPAFMFLFFFTSSCAKKTKQKKQIYVNNVVDSDSQDINIAELQKRDLRPDFSHDNKIVFKQQNGHYVPIEHFNELESKKELITIFVHGTILPYPSISNILQTLKGDVNSPVKQENFWHKYIHNIRFRGVYKFQPIQKIGLHKIDLDKKDNLTTYELSSQKISNMFSKIYRKNNRAYKDYSYYTFGWSGRLDKKRRLESAKPFYDQLVEVIREIKKRNKDDLEPDVQVFAHSHGGNVALNLAVMENENRLNLKIKDLILLGTPVQEETKDLINSGVFDCVWNFYSKGDDVQVIDILSTKKHHSRRTFKKRRHEKILPTKLVQVQVKCDKLKPRHSELWLIKTRTNLLYRNRLSISPYPISVYTLDIIRLLKKYFKNSNNIKINIRNIKNQKNKFNVTIKDFDSFIKNSYNLEMPI